MKASRDRLPLAEHYVKNKNPHISLVDEAGGAGPSLLISVWVAESTCLLLPSNSWLAITGTIHGYFSSATLQLQRKVVLLSGSSIPSSLTWKTLLNRANERSRDWQGSRIDGRWTREWMKGWGMCNVFVVASRQTHVNTKMFFIDIKSGTYSLLYWLVFKIKQNKTKRPAG